MAPPPDSLRAFSRWNVVASETQMLLQRHDDLMQQRVELCRQRAVLFRELVRTAKGFVAAAGNQTDQSDDTSTGTVASSSRRR
jgi:hypothetical protein